MRIEEVLPAIEPSRPSEDLGPKYLEAAPEKQESSPEDEPSGLDDVSEHLASKLSEVPKEPEIKIQ